MTDFAVRNKGCLFKNVAIYFILTPLTSSSICNEKPYDTGYGADSSFQFYWYVTILNASCKLQAETRRAKRESSLSNIAVGHAVVWKRWHFQACKFINIMIELCIHPSP